MISDINIELLTNEGYTEIEHIGQGSYGTVYKCYNKRNKLVAVKIPNENNVSDINEGLKEAFHLKGLKHENIVKVYNVMLLEIPKIITKLAIEMEYLNYGNLNNVIVKKKINLSENLIYKILQQTCDALKYLEENEVVHRDLNLNNIVIKHFNQEKDEIEIVLIDFGFVKSINSEQSTSIRGTVGFLAPELLENNNNNLQYSFKSDIFALGVTLYRLMSFDSITDIGRSLHSFNEQTIKDLITNNIKNNKNVKYSDKLINLILKMLEKDTIERFNAEEILNEIEKNKINLIGFSNQFEFVGQFGSKGSGNDQFKNPYDILIDNDLIYIVDTYNKRISLFNLENNQYVKQFNLNFKPSCIKLDKTNDTLLIGNFNFNVIYRFNKNFELLQQYGENNGNKSYCISVSGIEVDESNGNIFICNNNDKKVQILTKDFKLIKEFTNNLNGPHDILLNKEKNELIISDITNHCIKIFTKDGQFIKLIGKKGKKENKFFYLSGFIYDIVNNQYIICDCGNNRIQIFNENFEFIKSFGSEGNGQNEFTWPTNLTINYKTGQLYIVDTDNHCIKIYK